MGMSRSLKVQKFRSLRVEAEEKARTRPDKPRVGHLIID